MAYLKRGRPEIFVAESEEEAKLLAERHYGCLVGVLERLPYGYTDEPFQQTLYGLQKGRTLSRDDLA